MADDDVQKVKLTETLIRFEVSELEGRPEWTDFIAKSKAFDDAKEAVTAAKKIVRETIRREFHEHLGVSETDVIDFATNGAMVTVTKINAKKTSGKPRAPVVSLKKGTETAIEHKKGGLGFGRK